MKTREELVNLGLEGYKADEVMMLQEKMLEGAVAFQYRKKDGSTRNAVGTLFRDLMKMADGTMWSPKGEERPADPKWFKYFDCDAGGWRQFSVFELLAVEGR